MSTATIDVEIDYALTGDLQEVHFSIRATGAYSLTRKEILEALDEAMKCDPAFNDANDSKTFRYDS